MSNYSIPSKGFVPATIIADNGLALVASCYLKNDVRPIIKDYNTPGSMKLIREMGKSGFLEYAADELEGIIDDNNVRLYAPKLTSNGFKDNMGICRKLKKRNPDLKIVPHGPQANWYARQILQLYPDSVDVISIGDGESSAVPLAKWASGHEDLENVPNTLYRDNTGEVKQTKRGRVFVDLNDLPHATYDSGVYLDIDEKVLMVMPDGGRGCSYGRCIFCAQPVHMGKFRERKTENTLHDIKYYQREYGARFSRLPDSSPRPRWINSYIKGLPPGHKTSFFMRADSEYDFDLMNDKVTAVFIGLESVRDDVLEFYRKTRNPKKFKEDCLVTTGECRDRGIGTTLSVIVPSPYETDETMKANLEFIKEINPDFCTPLPIGVLSGTPLEAMILNDDYNGIRLDDDYKPRMMLMELDLIDLDVDIPYEVMVNGDLRRDMLEHSIRFASSLMKDEIFPASDENVTMADMYHGGLSKDQKERRDQVMHLNSRMKKAASELDHEDMADVIDTIRRNGNGGG